VDRIRIVGILHESSDGGLNERYHVKCSSSQERLIMRIGQLAQQANVSASAVRYYERIGFLPAPSRVNGRREYSADALARLAIVLHARGMGFTIAETGRLLAVFPTATPSARWKSLAAAKLEEMDALIAHAKAIKTTLQLISKCRCESWDECGAAVLARAHGRTVRV
jgi:DNA-binding transcriptional MerR regulator